MNKKKQLFEKTVALYPVITILVIFLSDCYKVFDDYSTVELDSFITKYKGCEIAPLAQYANGLLSDYEAVKNSLIYKDISNGPSVIAGRLLSLVKRSDHGYLLKTQWFLSRLTGDNISIHASYRIREFYSTTVTKQKTASNVKPFCIILYQLDSMLGDIDPSMFGTFATDVYRILYAK